MIEVSDSEVEFSSNFNPPRCTTRNPQYHIASLSYTSSPGDNETVLGIAVKDIAHAELEVIFFTDILQLLQIAGEVDGNLLNDLPSALDEDVFQKVTVDGRKKATPSEGGSAQTKTGAPAHQTPLKIVRTYFEQSPLLLGSLYYYLHYLTEECKARDELIQELNKHSGRWIILWPCWIELLRRKSARHGFVPQPPRETKLSTSATEMLQATQQCEALDELLQEQKEGSETCKQAFTQQVYFQIAHKMTNYFHEFIENWKSQACYGGELDIGTNFSTATPESSPRWSDGHQR